MTCDSNSTFDCVETIHQGATLVQAELANKSLEEQVNYWNKRTVVICLSHILRTIRSI